MALTPLLTEPLSRIVLNRVDASNASQRTVALDQSLQRFETLDDNKKEKDSFVEIDRFKYTHF